MGNFKEKLARFMNGRYGVDQLYYAFIVVCFVFIVVNVFTHSAIIGILIWALMMCAVIRSFSRNVYKRRAENEKFLKIWNPVKAKCSLAIRRIKEIKTHRFRKCPYCKAVLRLPRRKGKHTVNCPGCHKEFELRILW